MTYNVINSDQTIVASYNNHQEALEKVLDLGDRSILATINEVDINKELVNVAYAQHNKYDWGWHQLQVVRGCWFAWEDRNGTTHRIDGHDKANLLERIKAL